MYSAIHRLLFTALFLWAVNFAQAQETPICFSFFFPEVEAEAGDTVCIPLMARNFNMIAWVQMGIQWDSNALELIHVETTPTSEAIGIGPLDYSFFDPGMMRIVWYDPLLMGVTLQDSVEILRLCFVIKHQASGFLPLKFGDINQIVQYEVGQMLPPDWKTVFMPLAYQIGGLQLDGPADNELTLNEICVQKAECNSPSGMVSATVSGGQLPYTYSWSGPEGFTANTATIENLIAGVYTVTVTDQAGRSVSGEALVKATPFQFGATVTTQSATCGLPNGCAQVQLAGQTQGLTVQWDDGSINMAQRCDLLPGIYQITVSDAQGCWREKEFEVKDITLNIGSASYQHVYDCNGLGWAKFNPLLSGQYTYLWSTGDTTQMIEQLQPGNYLLTANYGTCVAQQSFQIKPFTDHWNLQLKGNCSSNDPLTGDLVLSYSPYASNMNYPLNVHWSNGAVHVIKGYSGSSTAYDTLKNVPIGNYAVTVIDAEGCNKTVVTKLRCDQLPSPTEAYPYFYLKDDYLDTQYHTDSCVGVYAHQFEQLQNFSFSIAWNNSRTELRGVRNIGVPGLELDDFVIDTAGLRVGVQWAHPTPVSLPPDQLLFEVCSSPTNNDNVGFLEFADEPVAATLTAANNQELTFVGKSGYILYDLYIPTDPVLCDVSVLPPNCASDGKFKISVESCLPDKTLLGSIYQKDSAGVYRYYDHILRLSMLDPGDYIAIGGYNYWYEEMLIHIPEHSAGSECVWPGDADNNGAVNHHDLLYLGLAYQTQGPARNDTNLDWLGQEAEDWAIQTNTTNINHKNCDTNGDGAVNAADTLAIVQNWGRVVNPSTDDPFGMHIQQDTAPLMPLLTIETDTIQANGQPVLLPIMLGSGQTPADSVYGLAFTIAYDPKIVEANSVRFIPAADWLLHPEKFMVLQKNFPEHGHIDVALTRTDGVPVSQWGSVGTMYVIIEDNIFGEPDPLAPQDTMVKSRLFFSGVQSLTMYEQHRKVMAPPVDLVIEKATSSASNPSDITQKIHVIPNPAIQYATIFSSAGGIKSVEWYNMLGTKVIQSDYPLLSSCQFDVKALQNGTYIVRIFTEQGVAVKKVIVSN
ncbi:MAG: T9SS type A sorting domain-containing protein [Saprospiraceae bacterium]|nr:T9SS type A sorting domain-containing protein [Saprospiraceae bacterium]